MKTKNKWMAPLLTAKPRDNGHRDHSIFRGSDSKVTPKPTNIPKLIYSDW